jgi:microcin C transport system substrate-binding protein
VCVVAALTLAGPAAWAGGGSHGLSAFGELKYKADFAHFDYVNPQAPKGGRLSTVGTGALTTFDSFNNFIIKGDAAQGLGLLYDSLMVAAADEPGSVYGLVAKSASVAVDRMSVTFHMRGEAKFADGSAVTADDCVFTFNTLKEKGHPGYRIAMRDVTKAEAIDRHTVRYIFSGTQTRDLPMMVASLPILPKAYYATRKFEETSLEPPLGSGPYRIGDFKPGTQVTYKRRDDYWARDLNVMRGLYNFDDVRYEYFRERTAGLENLKSGGFDLREEFTSKDWATAYEAVPAIKDGRLRRLDLADETPSGTQGYWINTRKAKFQDPRVRRALDMAFDYEWTNKNLFYGLYKRTTSFFENSDMKAAGKPSGEELALLEPFRDKLPPSVFEEAYVPPVSDGNGIDRKQLRDANRLLMEAGWTLKDNKRINAKGDILDVEFLVTDPSSERILGKYVESLQALGVQAVIRKVDETAYQRRVKQFDFDVISGRFVMSATPGLELRSMFGSEAAKQEASRNLSGISNPVVDALIEKIIGAKSRADLTHAARALDRVLRASHYWVPHWYKAGHWIVHWDKFGRPPVKPRFARGIIETWWYDNEKAAKLKTN